MKSQNAISSWGGRREFPNLLTEYGVAMLASIINIDTDIEVNRKEKLQNMQRITIFSLILIL